MAAHKVIVTPQAIEQRHTRRFATFLEELFRRAIKVVVVTLLPTGGCA